MKGIKGFQKGHKINQGRKFPPEFGAKISKTLTGRKMDSSFREKARARQLGKIPSLETRAKLALVWKGRKHKEFTKLKLSNVRKGSGNPMYGKKLSKEHRLKISESLKLVKARTRDLTFKEVVHELRNSPQYKMWREDVFKRDKFTCLWCLDSKGGNLEADHIKPFTLILKLNAIRTIAEGILCRELWDISNGRTLCKSCHRTTDTWGAKAKLLWQ